MTVDRTLDLHAISEIAAIDRRIADLNAQLGGLRQERQQHEAALIESAARHGSGLEGEGYRVRWNAGRTVTTWDAAQLDVTLPDDLKAVVLTYLPKANTPVLNALEKTGKLPPSALDAKTVTEPQGRWVLEAAK